MIVLWASGCELSQPTESAGPDSGTAQQAPPVDRPSTAAFPFFDATAVSGVDFVHDNGASKQRHFPETMAPGIALFDADLDGDLDLYAVNGGPLQAARGSRPPNRLYFNRGDGTFVDVTESSGAGDTGYGMGVAVGDYDGDGLPDLYVLNYGANALYRNLGEGTFAEVKLGVEDPSWSVGGAFLDFDHDGDLDLYVVNYLDYDMERARPCKAGTLTVYCSPESFAPASDRLYRNDQDRFTDVSTPAGVVADGRGMGLAVGDLDMDGDADIYVTNDRSRNHLYWNENGRFREGGTEAGVGYSLAGQVEGGMGAVIADLTGEGRSSIFATNFQKEPNRLFTYAGDGYFDDRTYASGLGFASQEMVSFGMTALDVEGDGDLDLAVANGHVFDNAEQFIGGSSFAMPDQLFLNDGRGGFTAIQFPGQPLPSRGVASGDIDGDGDPDLVIASCGGPLQVWRNDAGTKERFVVLKLEGAGANTAALGSRATARIGQRLLQREVAGGGSYASHSDSRLHFGTAAAGKIDHFEIRWPDGSVAEAQDIAAGQTVVWRQGEGIVARRPLGVPPERSR